MIDGFDTGSLIATFLMFGGVTAVGLLRAFRYPRATAVSSWMTGHGLDPESSARQTVAAYLGRTRWIRTGGFLAGWNVPFVWMWVTRSAYRMDELGNYWWTVGFALGVFLAEVARPRTAGAATVVEPRRLGHYLPDFTRVDRWILVVLSVLPVAASVLLPLAEPQFPNETAIERETLVWYAGLSLLAIATIFITRLVQESIVRRRQRFDDVEEMRVDDAMRSASVQGLAGPGYAVPMWISATMAWDLVVTTSAPATWIFAILGAALMVGGLGMLTGFPRMNSKWVVARARQA